MTGKTVVRARMNTSRACATDIAGRRQRHKRFHRRGRRRLVVGGGKDALVDGSDDLFLALDQQHGDPFQRGDFPRAGHRQMRRYHRDLTHRHVADVRRFGVMIGERKHTGLPFAPASPRSPPADSRAVATTRGAPLLSPVLHRESRVFRSGLHLSADWQFQAPCHGGPPENAAFAREEKARPLRRHGRAVTKRCGFEGGPALPASVRCPPQSRSGLTLSTGSRRRGSSCGR